DPLIHLLNPSAKTFINGLNAVSQMWFGVNLNQTFKYKYHADHAYSQLRILHSANVANATTHMRTISSEIRKLTSMREDELFVAAKELQAPYELVKEVASTGKLPVVLFTAGGIATPADAAMMMQLGADGVFVGSGIFKSGDPAKRAAACVKAVTYFSDAKVIAEVSRGLGEAMVGINVADIPVPHRLAERGW
ncbi:MAG: hypothetical protein RIS06_833, partial [Actinomycetota bacterium]